MADSHGCCSSVRSSAIPSGQRYDGFMLKRTRKPPGAKNGNVPAAEVSELGRVLQKLADKYAASGGKLLNRRQLEREVAERRGLR